MSQPPQNPQPAQNQPNPANPLVPQTFMNLQNLQNLLNPAPAPPDPQVVVTVDRAVDEIMAIANVAANQPQLEPVLRQVVHQRLTRVAVPNTTVISTARQTHDPEMCFLAKCVNKAWYGVGSLFSNDCTCPPALPVKERHEEDFLGKRSVENGPLTIICPTISMGPPLSQNGSSNNQSTGAQPPNNPGWMSPLGTATVNAPIALIGEVRKISTTTVRTQTIGRDVDGAEMRIGNLSEVATRVETTEEFLVSSV